MVQMIRKKSSLSDFTDTKVHKIKLKCNYLLIIITDSSSEKSRLPSTEWIYLLALEAGYKGNTQMVFFW